MIKEIKTRRYDLRFCQTIREFEIAEQVLIYNGFSPKEATITKKLAEAVLANFVYDSRKEKDYDITKILYFHDIKCFVEKDVLSNDAKCVVRNVIEKLRNKSIAEKYHGDLYSGDLIAELGL